jgi:hypothetical protein
LAVCEVPTVFADFTGAGSPQRGAGNPGSCLSSVDVIAFGSIHCVPTDNNWARDRAYRQFLWGTSASGGQAVRLRVTVDVAGELSDIKH